MKTIKNWPLNVSHNKNKAHYNMLLGVLCVWVCICEREGEWKRFVDVFQFIMICKKKREKSLTTGILPFTHTCTIVIVKFLFADCAKTNKKKWLIEGITLHKYVHRL